MCTECTAALADTLRCSISFNGLCSELAAKKEKEHLMHSMIFNSDNPIDIHLSNPGDNVEELDPTTKMATNKPNKRPIPLRRSSGGPLDITGGVFDVPPLSLSAH